MPKIYTGLELISVHIPKAAGTSFRKLLEEQYQQDLECFYGGDKTLALWKEGDLELTRNSIRVVHGHFRASRKLLQQCPNAKLITWIRHPVDRLISYYYFWESLAPHGNPCHDQFLKDRPGLVEFSQQEYMKGEWAAYFGDVPMNLFDYIGLVESYDEGIEYLAQMLGWGAFQVKTENRNASKPDISHGERLELEKSLAEDIEMYESWASYSRKRFTLTS
ncbi:sulfotransferase family 2 domain-containing protein [Pelagicoccus mobilis]|uniref:Sulfotransferase family 2 domain-containing protein n=1 Tax=Pelagicoccus mobilis TaxID=415221 RepID=A0A934VS86_9BACT|nr:sulfotransferase family 2 domain-containing protein [Pelagicoccus mobilis]MBK1878408.1 sulfotransferase family 2 domain-containing protein [Pelagicoccus mobilis]